MVNVTQAPLTQNVIICFIQSRGEAERAALTQAFHASAWSVSSVGSLVKLLRWNHHLQPWALVFVVRVSSSDQTQPGALTRIPQAHPHLGHPTHCLFFTTEYRLAFQKVIPRPCNEVKSSAKQFLLEHLRSESCSTWIYLVYQASRDSGKSHLRGLVDSSPC